MVVWGVEHLGLEKSKEFDRGTRCVRTMNRDWEFTSFWSREIISFPALNVSQSLTMGFKGKNPV